METKKRETANQPKTKAMTPNKRSENSGKQNSVVKKSAADNKKQKIVNFAELETVCGISSVLPVNTMPEFAFVGKSNVGKSSMINCLMNRKSLARTSAQPGKTQTINFYNIDHELYFVDLPGYGYAKVSQELKAKWGKMIEAYLKKSLQLKQIFLLIDIRHEPNANDCNMYDWLVHQGLNPVLILTKLDKINRSQKEKQIKIIKNGLKAKPGTIIIPFSAETKQGRDELWELLDRLRKGDPDAEIQEENEKQIEREEDTQE